MLYKKKWQLLHKTIDNSQLTIDKLIAILLSNRGIKTKQERESFLHPKLEEVTVDSVGIDQQQLAKAIKRIQYAIENNEQIVVFGDYDVDGITGAAILWETLHELGAIVVPYIPHRVDEGYGLSVTGISNLQSFSSAKASVDKQISNIKLIITVDNGIVAHEAVHFANEQEIDVIVTDHHMRSEKDPDAFAIVHTTKLCGAGVAWMLSNVIASSAKQNEAIPSKSAKITNDEIAAPPIRSGTRKDVEKEERHLELVALATVADLVPLTAANRTLVTYGLERLRKTKRVGLLALFQEAGIEPEKIGVYEIGHIIGPRLNAMGRMANAMDSLRLLCTRDSSRAQVLAAKLGKTNKERQLLTQEMAEHALEKVQSAYPKGTSFPEAAKSKVKSLLFVAHETYEQGVIGLVASKLVERYYRPSIVVSIGEKVSKASARSVAGFNIIEFIRSASHLLVNAGGHPMAAGFTVETGNLGALQEAFEKLAGEQVSEELLQRILKIDCELPLDSITQDLYDSLQQLQPFGMANPEPVFVSKGVKVEDIRAIGVEKKHLKLRVSQDSFAVYDAIAFGMGEYISEIKIGDAIDIAYVVDENEWNGNKKLQLKIKDIKKVNKC